MTLPLTYVYMIQEELDHVNNDMTRSMLFHIFLLMAQDGFLKKD